MNVTKDNLESLFPYPVSMEEIPAPKDKHLIALLLKRKFYSIKIDSLQLIGICPKPGENYSANVYKKHLAEYEQKLDEKCIFILNNPTDAQVDSFLKNQIPFVSDRNQVYIPFLGIMLAKSLKVNKYADDEKMMPATQELFLYMFYGKKKYYLKSEAADELNLTRTSLTRASEQLIAMNLITQTKVGKEYRMELLGAGSELFRKAEKFLITPVFKSFYVDSKDLAENGIKTGESALAMCSMMNPPKIPQVALYKDDKRAKNLIPVDIRWEDCENPVEVQLWKYPPEIFSKEGRVDTVSMLCTLKAIFDERIEGEVEEIIGEERW